MKKFLSYGGILILSIFSPFSLFAQSEKNPLDLMKITVPDGLKTDLSIYINLDSQAPMQQSKEQALISTSALMTSIENIGGKYFDFYSDREVKARLILKNGQSYAIVLPIGLGAFARFAPELHSIHFEEGAEGVLRFFPTGREPKASLPLISLYSD